MSKVKTSPKIIKYIKGSEIPGSWEVKVQPSQTFVVIEVKGEDENLPSEEMFTDEFIESIKRSEEDYKAGRFTRCETDEEIDNFFQKILNE